MVDNAPILQVLLGCFHRTNVGSCLPLSGPRRFFLILGALWGLMAASRPYLAASKYTQVVPA
jgi:hypothetical protein